MVVGVEAEEQPADGVGVQCLRVAVVGDGAEEEVPANDAGDDAVEALNVSERSSGDGKCDGRIY